MPGIALEIRRKCKVCGKVFIAKTLDSQFCCKRCGDVFRKRQLDVKKREETLSRIILQIPDAREYISVKVEMTDECLTAIQSAREKLIQSETDLLASHRRLQLQEFHNQNEEIMSFIKSCQGVFLSPKVFWWWAGISYATSLYSLWCLLQLLRHWLK